ncbi:MAG: Ig-like domain-containing protein [Lachnospiraceae bacterium]|nr:Ig-like domain-containing protein [Lachnospiraceae bacterium]
MKNSRVSAVLLALMMGLTSAYVPGISAVTDEITEDGAYVEDTGAFPEDGAYVEDAGVFPDEKPAAEEEETSPEEDLTVEEDDASFEEDRTVDPDGLEEGEFAGDLILGVDDEENPTRLMYSFKAADPARNFHCWVYYSPSENGNGEFIGEHVITADEFDESGVCHDEINAYLTKSGYYFFRIAGESGGFFNIIGGDNLSEESNRYHYVAPDVKIPFFSGMKWNAASKTLTWTYPAGWDRSQVRDVRVKALINGAYQVNCEHLFDLEDEEYLENLPVSASFPDLASAGTGLTFKVEQGSDDPFTYACTSFTFTPNDHGAEDSAGIIVDEDGQYVSNVKIGENEAGTKVLLTFDYVAGYMYQILLYGKWGVRDDFALISQETVRREINTDAGCKAIESGTCTKDITDYFTGGDSETRMYATVKIVREGEPDTGIESGLFSRPSSIFACRNTGGEDLHLLNVAWDDDTKTLSWEYPYENPEECIRGVSFSIRFPGEENGEEKTYDADFNYNINETTSICLPDANTNHSSDPLVSAEHEEVRVFVELLSNNLKYRAFSEKFRFFRNMETADEDTARIGKDGKLYYKNTADGAGDLQVSLYHKDAEGKTRRLRNFLLRNVPSGKTDWSDVIFDIVEAGAGSYYAEVLITSPGSDECIVCYRTPVFAYGTGQEKKLAAPKVLFKEENGLKFSCGSVEDAARYSFICRNEDGKWFATTLSAALFNPYYWYDVYGYSKEHTYTVRAIAVPEDITGIAPSDAGEGAFGISEEISSVSIDPVGRLAKGSSIQLNVTNNHFNAKGVTYVWSSSAPGIVSVSDTGLVTGLEAGKATITVSATDAKGNTVTDECLITVSEVGMTGFRLSSENLTLTAGGSTAVLTPVFTPADATIVSCEWESKNKAVAVVSDEGVVTPLSPGTAVISCTAEDANHYAIYAKCDVTVNAVGLRLAPDRTDAEGRGLVAVGKTLKINPVLEGEAEGKPVCSWLSSDATVASVSPSGTVTGKRPGFASILSMVKIGGTTVNAICNVRVYEPVSKITLNKKEITIGTGEKFTLKGTVSPAYAEAGLTFSSSNEEVASVSASGVVTAKNVPGKAKITATATDGSGKTAVCEVKVGKALESIEIRQAGNVNKLAVGKTLQFKAVLNGGKKENAPASKEVIFQSSDPAVASVDTKGKVKAVSAGTVKLKAIHAATGTPSGEYELHIYAPLIKASLNVSRLNLKEGDIFIPSLTTVPASPTGLDAEWASSGPAVASVDPATGTIHALTKGKTVITATLRSEGNVKKTVKCTVNVVGNDISVTKVSLDKKKAKMGKKALITISAMTAPVNAKEGGVEWSISSGEGLITIEDNGNGTVTVHSGDKTGKAKVTATAKDGSGKKETCEITVGNSTDNITVTGPKTVKVGKSANFKAAVEDEDGKKAANSSVIWSIDKYSSDTGEAVISKTGVLKALKPGTVTVVATSPETREYNNEETGSWGTYQEYEKYRITVVVPVNRLSLTRTKISIAQFSAVKNPDNTFSYTPIPGYAGLSVNPDATDQRITWKMDGSAKRKGLLKLARRDAQTGTLMLADDYGADITVDYKNGESLAFLTNPEPGKAGKAVLTGTACDGSGKKVKLTVTILGNMRGEDVGIKIKKAPKGAAVSGNGTAKVEVSGLKKGATFTLTKMVTRDAADKSVIFRSTDPSVATVSGKGVVTIKKSGEAKIIMQTADRGYSATCSVTAQ